MHLILLNIASNTIEHCIYDLLTVHISPLNFTSITFECSIHKSSGKDLVVRIKLRTFAEE